MQKAVFHGPGRSSVLVLCKRNRDISNAEVRDAAARMLQVFERPLESALVPRNLKALIGLAPGCLDDHAPFEGVSKEGRDELPGDPFHLDSEHDLLVQVSADTEIDRVVALRIIDACIRDKFEIKLQATGGRMLNWQEYLGFRDGSPPNSAQFRTALGGLHSVSTAQQDLEADLQGKGCWLLHQQFALELEKFFELNDDQRADVIGRVPAQTAKRGQIRARLALGLPSNSHGKLMQSGFPIPMLRRGFPCRTEKGFEMVFLAVAEVPRVFADALRRMIDPSGATIDRVLEFAKARAGGVYFCPPDAAWLGSSQSVASLEEVSPSAAYLQRSIPLVSYETTSAFLDYLQMLIGAGVFSGPTGSMKLAPYVQPHIEAMHAALAQRSQFSKEDLDGALKLAQDQANVIHAALDEPLTLS